MSGIFSFIKHPLLYLLNAADKIIPGIEKVIVLYYDGVNDRVVCRGRTDFSDVSIEEYTLTSESLIKGLRAKSFAYKWLSADNLPFETIQAKKKQLNIFDELNHVVLNLGITNQVDGKTDLIYIYLKPNHSNFGIPGQGGLTTNEKSIVGSLLYNNVKFTLSQQQQDIETLRLISQKVNDYQEENNQLKEQLQQFKSTFQDNMLELCQQHLHTIALNLGVDVILSPDAIEKIETFNGNMDDLKLELERVSSVAFNLSMGASPQIVLRAWDIQFSAYEGKKSASLQVKEPYQRTLLLLNKLENAARRVVNDKQKLTSENVGNACPQPISAPAISDSLKNHQKKVFTLMQNYPDKWATIRNEFRPIKNILQDINVG